MTTDHEIGFILKTHQGKFQLKILEVYGFPDQTCTWGGYETRSIVEIIGPNYSLQGSLCIATGELFNFYTQLKNCYQTLSGTASLSSFEDNLQMDTVFDGTGNLTIEGSFVPNHEGNKLVFAFECDQSYIPQTLEGLNKIFLLYGDNKGKRTK